jgi:hypothetical protein
MNLIKFNLNEKGCPSQIVKGEYRRKLKINSELIMGNVFIRIFCVVPSKLLYTGKNGKGCIFLKKLTLTFFIAVPCNVISLKSFIHQQMHNLLILENFKIYIET